MLRAARLAARLGGARLLNSKFYPFFKLIYKIEYHNQITSTVGDRGIWPRAFLCGWDYATQHRTPATYTAASKASLQLQAMTHATFRIWSNPTRAVNALCAESKHHTAVAHLTSTRLFRICTESSPFGQTSPVVNRTTPAPGAAGSWTPNFSSCHDGTLRAASVRTCATRSIASPAAGTAGSRSGPGIAADATAAASSAGGREGGAAAPRLQPVDYSTLAACCAELRRGWVPAKVEQVVMPDKTTLCLRLRTPGGQGWLRISWHPAAGRVTMMTQGSVPERGNASELYSLGEAVHGTLSGLVLVDVGMPVPWERVADLRFGVRPGEAPSHHLYCEVMARYSNVVLTDAGGLVLAAAYQVGGMMSSHRQVQVGRTYALPPQLYGVPPTAASASLEQWRDTLIGAAALAAAAQRQTAEQRRKKSAPTSSTSAAPGAAVATDAAAAAAAAAVPARGDGLDGSDGRLVDGFIRAFHGVSPSLVDELCGAVGVTPAASPAGLAPEQWVALYEQWMTWQERLCSGDFAASSDPARGRFSVFGGGLHTRHESVHAMLEEYYGPLTAAEAHGQLHGKLAAAVAAALKKARGKVRAFEQQLSESDRSEEVRRVADLITANLYRIPAGSSTAEVEDWETGQPVTVQLDATKPPVATAEGLYRKARKLRRAVEVVQPLLEEARSEVAYLEDVEVVLAALKRWSGDPADGAALREVQDELVAGKYVKPPPDAALAQKTAARAAKAAARKAGKGGGKKGAGGTASAASVAAAAADGGLDSSSARRYTSPGGFTVLVGRNNKQNDVLSTQVAADGDLWFHVRGLPGSHTLLRVPRGSPEPGDADVQFAADLAAFFSKARDSLKVDVIVARGGWVKKPRGAKPGAVVVTKELRNAVGRPGDSVAAAAAGPGEAREGRR